MSLRTRLLVTFLYPKHVNVNFAVLLLSISLFFNDTATTEIYTLSLHDALPISPHGVFDDLQDVLVVIRRVRFVARAEVDDPAGAARPRAAAAEDFAAREAGNEERTLGLGDVEELAVHLLAWQDEVVVHVPHDRVAGAGDPEDLALVGLAPLEVARGAHQALEDLGEVPAVQDDQAHAVQDRVVHAFDDLVRDFIVRDVA